MDTFLDFLGGGLSGGLFGILGGLGTSWIKHIADKAKYEHDLKMLSAESEATIRETKANIQRDQINMDGLADIEESKGRNEAILKLSEDYVKGSLVERMMFNKNKWSAWITAPIALLITLTQGLVDVSRTLVRPLVTYGSVVFSCYVTYIAFGMYTDLDIAMTSNELYEIIQTMLRLLTFTTSTVIGFWFMDKSMSRKFQNTI